MPAARAGHICGSHLRVTWQVTWRVTWRVTFAGHMACHMAGHMVLSRSHGGSHGAPWCRSVMRSWSHGGPHGAVSVTWRVTWRTLVQVRDAQLVVLRIELEEQRVQALGRVVHRAGVRRVQDVALTAAGQDDILHAQGCEFTPVQSIGGHGARKNGWALFGKVVWGGSCGGV
eukprot:5150202-Prymnesium_polylepis.2